MNRFEKTVTTGMVIWACFCIAMTIALIVVAVHFAAKYW